MTVADDKLATFGVKLTAYDIQVLLGTSISGCNMSPDRVFDLEASWAKLRAAGLIDRADGLACPTTDGEKAIAAIIAASDLLVALELASNKFAFAAGLTDPTNKNMFLQGAKAFCDAALARSQP